MRNIWITKDQDTHLSSLWNNLISSCKVWNVLIKKYIHIYYPSLKKKSVPNPYLRKERTFGCLLYASQWINATSISIENPIHSSTHNYNSISNRNQTWRTKQLQCLNPFHLLSSYHWSSTPSFKIYPFFLILLCFLLNGSSLFWFFWLYTCC